MSPDLSRLSASIDSSIRHDSWIAALADRVRAEALARHRVVVTESLRLRVDLAHWRDWFAARADWSVYIGSDHLGRAAALGYHTPTATSVRLKLDLSARRADHGPLREILRLDDALAPEPRDSGGRFPGEISVLGAPEPVADVATQLRAAFAPAGSTVH